MKAERMQEQQKAERMKAAAFVCFTVVWFGFGFSGGGIVNANFRCSFPDSYSNARKAREGVTNIAVPTLLGPIGLAMSLLSTSFAMDGWNYSISPMTAEEKLKCWGPR